MLGAIMGLLGLGGNIAYSAISSKVQFDRQMKLQKQSQKWTEYMSNTAHQREVADLRKAGMNPILTANGGNGASWSSPSSGHAEQSGSVDFAQAADALNTAASVDVAEKNAETQAAAQESQAEVNDSAIALNMANAALAYSKAQKERASVPIYEEGSNILQKGIESFKTLGDKNTWKGIFGSSSAKSVNKSSVPKKSVDNGTGVKHVPGFKNYPGRSVPVKEEKNKTPGNSWQLKTTKGWKR